MPEVGFSSPVMSLMMVDLPEPEGPIRKQKLAVLDLHGNAVEGLVTLRIGFYNISKFNHIRIFLPS